MHQNDLTYDQFIIRTKNILKDDLLTFIARNKANKEQRSLYNKALMQFILYILFFVIVTGFLIAFFWSLFTNTDLFIITRVLIVIGIVMNLLMLYHQIKRYLKARTKYIKFIIDNSTPENLYNKLFEFLDPNLKLIAKNEKADQLYQNNEEDPNNKELRRRINFYKSENFNKYYLAQNEAKMALEINGYPIYIWHNTWIKHDSHSKTKDTIEGAHLEIITKQNHKLLDEKFYIEFFSKKLFDHKNKLELQDLSLNKLFSIYSNDKEKASSLFDDKAIEAIIFLIKNGVFHTFKNPFAIFENHQRFAINFEMKVPYFGGIRPTWSLKNEKLLEIAIKSMLYNCYSIYSLISIMNKTNYFR
ncbi:hypothetical protein VO56_00900 [Mycoplasmopsis gallinacea]|uniref:DUF3137 domain-containing protein n=1 Tax=Mycoplasmopsis gallinacea TaxID=29556 RepID=A0A0D5ZJC1_9BACT|nr:hypothetical protein VO56_00900 [Mycoplasmopsis gallinacea]